MERHLHHVAVTRRLEPGRLAPVELGGERGAHRVAVAGRRGDEIDREAQGGHRIGPGHGADVLLQEPDQLGVEERPHVRRVEDPVHRIEALAHLGAGRHHVGHHDAASGAAHAPHLVDRAFGVGEVVQRGAAHHEIEAGVDEGQPGDGALLQQDVVDTRVAEADRTRVEERPGQIDADDLTHVRRELLGDVPGAAGHVEHHHPGVERLHPARDGVGAPGEGCVGAGEQADLALERRAGDGVVLVRLHAPIATLHGRGRLRASGRTICQFRPSSRWPACGRARPSERAR